MAEKKTISYPEWLGEVIEEQIEADIANNRSEWFQQAAILRLQLQESALEARGGQVMHEKLDELGLDAAEVVDE